MTTLPRACRPDSTPALTRLLAESALSRSALAGCGVPLALIDATGRTASVTYVNAAFQAFFGYSEAEAVGRPIARLVFRDDEPLVQRLLADAPRRWELGAWTKGGEGRPVEAMLAALRDSAGKTTHWVLAFSDRTEIERLRAEVESLKAVAAASLNLRLEALPEPAGRAEQPRIEVSPADELYADRQPGGILQQR